MSSFLSLAVVFHSRRSRASTQPPLHSASTSVLWGTSRMWQQLCHERDMEEGLTDSDGTGCFPAESATRAQNLWKNIQLWIFKICMWTHIQTQQIPNMLLSENRKATSMSQQQCYSSHPERFTDAWQVLSRQSLTGCCYWRVGWSGRGVFVAVTYCIRTSAEQAAEKNVVLDTLTNLWL